jgi:hypothetical protein
VTPEVELENQRKRPKIGIRVVRLYGRRWSGETAQRKLGAKLTALAS